ncbi:TFIIA-alpha and beta-like factor [Megalops cyprinoides]|uniref:TFIIA-alpha and beta-like factor n=1 Tax=Megalops cyprinoides TaxID=118141 RepID=UPI001864D4C9|nr:TFIIA-alpha and beta-like factor [Megalops cyprinoides]
MLSSSNPVPKLYLSIIEDVIESMRELFLDEGLEERVLEDLRQLWESKVMQSKAVEGFRNDTLNPSNFVLQLPANYAHTLHKPAASIVIPAGQNIQNFTTKNSTGSLATFALPPGVSYPVQIPGGVTLQTTSGQLYKVSVPVMVTQAPAGHRILSQPVRHLLEQKEAQASQGAVPPTILQTVAPPLTDLYTPPAPAGLLQHPPEVQQQQVLLTQSTPPNPPAAQPPVILQAPQLPPDSPSDSLFTGDGIEFSPQPLDMSLPMPLSAQLSGLQAPSCQMPVLGSEVSVQGEEEMPKEEAGAVAKEAEGASPEAPAKLEAGLMHDYGYNALGDIVQLDGPCGSSSEEDGGDEGAPDGAVAGENEFLGMISAEALRALQEGEDSSPGGSSDSDSDKAEEPLVEEEEDPLNSGDDVSEQDVPDLFDTDNVVVCQYDKIHRSKNRWKFYLKDGVMCLGGKDYVFSKAVGEAEW